MLYRKSSPNRDLCITPLWLTSELDSLPCQPTRYIRTHSNIWWSIESKDVSTYIAVSQHYFFMVAEGYNYHYKYLSYPSIMDVPLQNPQPRFYNFLTLKVLVFLPILTKWLLVLFINKTFLKLSWVYCYTSLILPHSKAKPKNQFKLKTLAFFNVLWICCFIIKK